MIAIANSDQQESGKRDTDYLQDGLKSPLSRKPYRKEEHMILTLGLKEFRNSQFEDRTREIWQQYGQHSGPQPPQ